MAIRMNLWSLTLLPGEKYPLYIRRDFTITNAALGEELRSPNGRSVVKVTHNPINPAVFDSDSEDEFDSDLEGELNDEFDIEEEDNEEDMVKRKVTKPFSKKVNGNAVADESDEEDDDDDFDDDEEIEETSVMCALTAGKIEQATLNLTFVEGEVVMFEVTGENAVHLLGNYINQFPESDSDSEYDSEEDDYSDIEDEDEELDSEEEAAIEAIAAKPKAKITEINDVPVAVKKEEAKPAQKRKADALESPASKPAAASAASAQSTEGLSKTQLKKLAKKQKIEAGEATAPAAAAKAETKEVKEVKKEAVKPQKRTLPSGLVIEDVKLGDGPVAKTGKRLGMRYIGKLDNGKQFDANTSGKPFSFMLGRGEVISGWDQGLAGMAVGGERRLIIPPQLAYGNQKIPGIPKNSTLTFEVKLVSVN